MNHVCAHLPLRYTVISIVVGAILALALLAVCLWSLLLLSPTGTYPRLRSAVIYYYCSCMDNIIDSAFVPTDETEAAA